jgi:hypothetical protein
METMATIGHMNPINEMFFRKLRQVIDADTTPIFTLAPNFFIVVIKKDQ